MYNYPGIELEHKKTFSVSAPSLWDHKSKNLCTNIDRGKQQSTINDSVLTLYTPCVDLYFICISVLDIISLK